MKDAFLCLCASQLGVLKNLKRTLWWVSVCKKPPDPSRHGFSGLVNKCSKNIVVIYGKSEWHHAVYERRVSQDGTLSPKTWKSICGGQIFILWRVATMKWVCGKRCTLFRSVCDTSESQQVLRDIRQSPNCPGQQHTYTAPLAQAPLSGVRKNLDGGFKVPLDRQARATERAWICHDSASANPPSRGQVTPLLGRFSQLDVLLSDLKVKPGSVDAVLLDAGCSSMQMDQAERGFSLSKDGPLDMRMDGER